MTGAQLDLPFFKKEIFHEFHPRIYGGSGNKAYINEQKDFVAIYPTPRVDYSHYVLRSEVLGLKNPKTTEDYLENRAKKTISFLDKKNHKELSLLEVGASDGACLDLISRHLPKADCAGVEPSKPHRDLAEKRGLKVYEKIEDLNEKKFDVICMYHTFEHFLDPVKEMKKISRALLEGGVFIIEIPSLTEPLISLYGLDAFKDFYFQVQHPFVYSPSSLSRLLNGMGYKNIKFSPFQRYGLANHMNWLKNNKPGVMQDIQQQFNSVDSQYKSRLEELGLTDTLFACFN